MPDPENGSVDGAAYLNRYFGLKYPLPPGWAAGLEGPPPSATGYYVLSALDGAGEGKPSLLVAAQDMFFGSKPPASAREMARDVRDSEAKVPKMTIEREPSEVMIGGRSFTRLDYSAGGTLSDVACHRHPLPRGDVQPHGDLEPKKIEFGGIPRALWTASV
jgi:hypothetical protein